MATTTTAISQVRPQTAEADLAAGYRRARLIEALTGLLFVAPVAIVAFTFQVLPVIYGFYLSMQGGVNVPEGFVGLEHFVKALGSLAYMLSLAIALIFALTGYFLYIRADRVVGETGVSFVPYLAPGYLAAVSTLLFFGFAFSFGLHIAWIPLMGLGAALAWYTRLNAGLAERGYRHVTLLYLVNSWGVALMTLSAVLLAWFTLYEVHRAVAPMFDIVRAAITDRRFNYVYPLQAQMIALAGTLAGLCAALATHNVKRRVDPSEQPRLASWLGLLRAFLIVAVIGLILYVLGAQEALNASLAQLARLTPEQLRPFTRLRLAAVVDNALQWQEVYTQVLGICFLVVAFYLWQNARRAETDLGLFGALAVALCLMIGGWLFIGELPRAMARGDTEFYASLVRTFTYSLVTVPTQLTLGLLLAYLLFYEVRQGKAFFRLVYFMPYIAPTVATATVFAMIFANREIGPANQILQAFGIPAQEWLRNPKGVFQIIAEMIGGPATRLPSFLVGPSLPLIAAILYAIWVYSGYAAVIFMAGLGNVPREMFEAAQVDGAGRWATFRNVIFPLISPTTFFLTVLAIIGTLRSFDSIFVLRQEDARGAMDTATVYIYTTILETSVIKTRPYAAALSFLLFGIILIMTIIQNRLSRDRVFYG